jgi:outer membrane protein assembly factor BamB
LAIAARIDKLIAAHGRQPYAEFEAAAATALATAEKRGDAREIARSAALYPNSLVATAALAKMASRREPNGGSSANATAQPELPPQSIRELADSQPLRVLAASPRSPAAVLLASNEGVRCVALHDEKQLWYLPLNSEATWARQAGDRVLIRTAEELVATSLENGAIRWRWSLGEKTKSSAQAVQFELCEGRVLVKQGGASMEALDAATGQSLWTFIPQGRVLGPLVFAAGDYVSLQHGEAAAPTAEPGDLAALRTVVLRARDGAVLHEWASGEGRWSSPPLAFDDSRMVTLTAANRVELVDLAAGELLWSRSPPDPAPGLPNEVAVHDPAIVICSGDGAVRRLNAADGIDAWREPVQLGEQSLSRGGQLAAIDDGALYCVTGGVLRAVELAGGRELWRRTLAEGEDDARRVWQASRVGTYVAAHPRQFHDGEGLSVVFVQAKDGEIAYRSPAFQSPPGEARLSVAGSSAVVEAPTRLWVLSFGGKQPERIRVSNK